jgi:hypothetical protein
MRRASDVEDVEEVEDEEEHSPLVEVAMAERQEAGAPEEIAPAAAGELGAGSHAPPATSPATPSCSRLVEAAMPKAQEAAVPATPPRAFLETACPPSSGIKRPPPSRSSASPGSSGGGRFSLSPPTDPRWTVVCRTKGRSREKGVKKTRVRGVSL